MVKFKVNNSWKYFIGFIISIGFIGAGVILIQNNGNNIIQMVGCLGVFIGGYWIGLIQKNMENIK